MSRRPPTPVSTPGSRRPALLPTMLLGASLAAAPHAAAQPSVLVQGVADAELWKTDSGSVLLTRNRGRAGTLERVHLWGAAELGHGVVLYAAGTAETGRARLEEGTEWYTDLAGVRYTRSEALVVDAGKMTQPLGAFASRRYSNRNPLIGVPDGYPVQYPLGVQVSGAHARVDYRAAVVSLPIYHEGYTPERQTLSSVQNSPSSQGFPSAEGGHTPASGGALTSTSRAEGSYT